MITTTDQFNLNHSLLQVLRNGSSVTAIEDTTGLHQGIRRTAIASLFGTYSWVTGSDADTFSIPPAAAGLMRLGFIYKIPTLSVAANRFIHRAGISRGSSNPFLGTGKVACKYTDDENGGRFSLEAFDGGTTLADSGVTVLADTWYYVVLELTQEECRLYIDTTPATRTLRATVAANIPTGLIRANFSCGMTTYTAGSQGISDYDDMFIEQVLL